MVSFLCASSDTSSTAKVREIPDAVTNALTETSTEAMSVGTTGSGTRAFGSNWRSCFLLSPAIPSKSTLKGTLSPGSAVCIECAALVNDEISRPFLFSSLAVTVIFAGFTSTLRASPTTENWPWYRTK